MSTAHHLTVVRCTYKIENFIEFEDRLDNSLARDVIKLEHVRMRMTFEPIMVGDLVDMEALELKFIFDRGMRPLSRAHTLLLIFIRSTS